MPSQLELTDARDWHYVSSANVKAVCWREENGLMVWFDPKDSSGRSTGQETVYHYPTQGYEKYIAMLAHPSKGRFVHEVLKHATHKGPFKPGE